MDKKLLEIYTDGACKGNPGIGGWGVIINSSKINKELYGGELDTTNNRMELTAILKALEFLTTIKPEILEKLDIQLYTDSNYACQGINSWLNNWKKNNWKTFTNKEVKNKDLWQQIDELKSKFKIQWCWVKGHNSLPGNEKADELANKGAEKTK